MVLNNNDTAASDSVGAAAEPELAAAPTAAVTPGSDPVVAVHNEAESSVATASEQSPAAAAAATTAGAAPAESALNDNEDLAKGKKDLPPWESKISVSTAPYGVPHIVKMGGGGWRVTEIAPDTISAGRHLIRGKRSPGRL